MEKSILNTPEVSNYGNDREAMGYARGYRACTADRNRLKDRRQHILDTRFGEFMSFVEDKTAKA